MNKQKLVSGWLILCALGVVYMIILGGYTRLTNSGLSIVEWRPVTGVLYPSTDNSWNGEFAKYKESPEYKQKNFNMKIDEFKQIYFVEYLHRLSGRILGVIFIIPFIYFIVSGALSRKTIITLAIILLLGAIQGAFGWYMVRSGLAKDPHVNHLRLALHMMTAILIYGMLLWSACKCAYNSTSKNPDKTYTKHLTALCALVLVQIFFGALTAGLDAGLIYNTFPLMDGNILPAELTALTPWYYNLFENPVAVQFMHRVLAFCIVVYVVFLYLKTRTLGILKLHFITLLLITTLQFAIGALTILHAVPLKLALFHQFFAIALFTVLLFMIFRLTYWSKNQLTLY